jgi:hypothetical protein
MQKDITMKRNNENKPHTINKHNMKIMTHFRQLRIKLTRKEKDLKKKNQHKLPLTNKTTKQVTKSRTKQHSTISDLKTITRNNNNKNIKIRKIKQQIQRVKVNSIFKKK